MDDDQLIAATARGDADAFAALYRRHLPRVVSYVMRASRDPEVAADLTAEVFAAVDVTTAVDGLPETERAAVRARVVDEREYQEIAGALESSESVIRQRASRGLARARSRLSVRSETEG